MASTTTVPGPSQPPLRHLWQVPAFVAGALAFAAALVACPPWHPCRGPCRDPALTELRERLRQPDFDGDRVLVLGAQAVSRAATPGEAGEAHFLLGSAYVVLAERAGPEKGRDSWREARAHLEQARALGVPEEDGQRLDYRLGKTWAHTGEPPRKVIDALAASVEGGAADDIDAVNGYGLLAEAYLHLPKPDLDAALAATEKQIGKPVVDPEVLAPARLLRGELLLRLDPVNAEGREVLKSVAAGAAAPLAARARRLLVRSLEHEEAWGAAAAVWREVLDDRKAPPPDRDVVLYHLGLCLRNAGQADEALCPWEECQAREGSAEEGPAAALGVAELRLRQSQVGPAAAALARAVREVKQPGDWHNALVPLPQAREAFESACRAARAAGDFEASLRMAQLYERLAPPGRAQELQAEAAEARGRAARDRARAAAGDEARKLHCEADALLRQAGEAYEKAADVRTDPAEQGERLWSAANDFLDGRAADRAAVAFQRFLDITLRPEMVQSRRFDARLNEAWYKLALAHRDAGRELVAREAFQRAANLTDPPSRYVYRARYELALTQRTYDSATQTWRWTDDAQATLEKNLSQLRRAITDRDDEAREKTLFALSDLYFVRRELNGVVSRAIDTLEEALREFPNNPAALTARYELAESYRFRADHLSRSLENERLTHEAELTTHKKVMEDREKAISNYQQLSAELEKKPQRTDDEERLLSYALFTAADARYLAGGYEQAGQMYERLAERYRDTPDHFSALANVFRCYQFAAQSYPSTSDYEAKVQAARQKADRALKELRAGLPRLDPKTRGQFERWLKAFEESN